MLYMEQKNYSFEIVLGLLRNENHIRGLAKILGINHMSVRRKLSDLFNENVVDYKKEGKNKNYFLKKTIEAKTYIFMSEEYKLLKTLKRYPGLRRIIENIQKNNKIKLAILFGSYAKGNAKKESDVDIFVDSVSRDLKKELELFDRRISIKIGRYEKQNILIKEIKKNHVIIKGVQKYYEQNKFFD